MNEKYFDCKVDEEFHIKTKLSSHSYHLFFQENILNRIHYHIANSYNEDACNAPHCIPHQKFAMTVFDQVHCFISLILSFQIV